MPLDTPTDKQRQVLVFVDGFSRAKGYAPSLDDVGRYFGFTRNAARDHLKALKRKGYTTNEERTPRTFALTTRGSEYIASTKEQP